MGVKLGQKWAVKDGNLLASNRVGSRFFNKEFDFSRASNGTYVDRDGLLKTAELYNLLSYSQDFSASTLLNTTLTDSQIDVNGQDDAYLLKDDSTSGEHYIILPAMSSTTNDYLTSSIYVKANGISKVQLWNYYLSNQLARVDFDLSNDTYSNGVYTNVPFISASIESLGNDWKRISITSYKPASSYAYKIRINLLDDGGNSSYSGEGNGVYIFGGQQVLGTEPLDYQYTNGLQGLPRISFEDGVGHLLLEPQRSNLLLQSNSFDTTWFKYNGASVGSRVADPFGGNNAWEINFSETNDSRIQQNVTTSIGVEYTFSVWARVTSGTKIIRIGAFNGVLAQKTLTTTWQRIEVSGVENDTNSEPQIRKFGSEAYTIQIFSAQLEAGSYPTSIIETTTTQITRLADVCNNSGSAQDFNSEEGVLYAEIAALANDGTYRITTLNDGTTDNRVSIDFTPTDNEIRCYIESGNVGQGSMTATVSNVLDFNKIAVKYKDNDYALWINGSEVATSTSALAPTALSQFDFDNATGNLPFYGKVRNLQVFTEALSDAELQQLTT